MVAQVAGSLMLLLITGFLVLGLSERSRIQTKVDPHTMVLLSLDPMRDGYSPEKAQALFEKLPEQLKGATSVRSKAMAAQPPFSMEDEDAAVQMTGSLAGRLKNATASNCGNCGSGLFCCTERADAGRPGIHGAGPAQPARRIEILAYCPQ